MLKIFIGIIVAFLAVIGFYAIEGSFAERVFSSGAVVLSILVLDRDDIESLEERIVDHISSVVMMRSQKLFLLLSEDVADDPKISEIARKYGAEIYVIQKIV